MATIKTVKNKKGTTYQVFIRIKGYKPVYKTFDKISKAKDFALKIESQMKDKTYKQPKFNDYHINTVSDLIIFFKDKEAQIRYKHYDKYNVMFDWWIKQIGSVQLDLLCSADLATCKRLLIAEKMPNGNKRKPNTINKYLMCMSAILKYAVKELQLIENNPMHNIDTVPVPEPRKRFLSLEEMKIYLEACKNHSLMIYLFALLGITTGGRYSEVLHLQMQNIDFKNQQLHYTSTKNKTDRSVYLNEKVIEVLKEYLSEKNITTGYLFFNQKLNNFYYIRGTLMQIIKDANIQDFRIHDARHTFASYMAMSGSSLLDIKTVLGHKSQIVTERYSHLTVKHVNTQVANAIESMNL